MNNALNKKYLAGQGETPKKFSTRLQMSELLQ
jgi:hypothetical protein